MARLSQGLIQGLTRPAFGEGLMAGTAAGITGMGAGRLLQDQQQQQQRMNQGLLTAYQTGASPGGSDPMAVLSALQEGTGADPKKLVAMMQAGQAQKQTQLEAQKEAERAQAARNRAKAMGYSEETINAYANDPEDLNALVDKASEKKAGQRLDQENEKSQVNRQVTLANQRGADADTIQDIKDGKYVGKNSDLLGMLGGEGDSIAEFQNIETGEVQSLTTLNGKVWQGGKWVNPSEAGLVRAPSRTAEDTTATFTAGQRSTSTAFSALGAGVIEDFVNETKSIGDLQKTIFETSVNPLTRDETARLRQVQAIVPDALARLQSGAAIKEDEMANFNTAYKIQLKDIASPQMMALKTIRTLLLTDITSRLTTGELSPPQARAMVQETARMGLSEPDKEKLRNGKFQEVVKPYISQIKGEGANPSQPKRIRYDAQGNRI